MRTRVRFMPATPLRDACAKALCSALVLFILSSANAQYVPARLSKEQLAIDEKLKVNLENEILVKLDKMIEQKKQYEEKEAQEAVGGWISDGSGGFYAAPGKWNFIKRNWGKSLSALVAVGIAGYYAYDENKDSGSSGNGKTKHAPFSDADRRTIQQGDGSSARISSVSCSNFAVRQGDDSNFTCSESQWAPKE